MLIECLINLSRPPSHDTPQQYWSKTTIDLQASIASPYIIEYTALISVSIGIRPDAVGGERHCDDTDTLI